MAVQAFGGGNTAGSIDVAACLTAKGQRIDFEVETFVAGPVADTLTSNGDAHSGFPEAAGLVASTIAPAITRNPYGDNESREGLLVAHTLKGEGFDASEDGTGRGTPIVPVSVAIRGREDGGTIKMGDDVAHALRASQGGGDKPHVLAPVYPIDMRQASRGEKMTNNRAEGSSGGAPGTGVGDDGDPAPTVSTSHPPAVAHPIPFDTTQMTSAANRSSPKPGDPCHPLAAGAHPPAIASDWAVRRLTPVECARLQGFPEYQRIVDINVCYLDQAKSCAPAETKNRKSPKNAKSAFNGESIQPAQFVESKSVTPRPSQEKLVDVSVLINCGQLEVRIHNRKKSSSSASNAVTKSLSRLPMPVEDFARLVARMTTISVPITHDGREGIQTSICDSTRPLSGRKRVELSGGEIEKLANDAKKLVEMAKDISMSTMSYLEQSGRPTQQTLQTWFYFVAAAIVSCIPNETRGAISSFRIQSDSTYLSQVIHNGKPLADGPMYKGLGNSWPVNSVRWIGRRIQMVEEIAAELDAANDNYPSTSSPAARSRSHA